MNLWVSNKGTEVCFYLITLSSSSSECIRLSWSRSRGSLVRSLPSCMQSFRCNAFPSAIQTRSLSDSWGRLSRALKMVCMCICANNFSSMSCLKKKIANLYKTCFFLWCCRVGHAPVHCSCNHRTIQRILPFERAVFHCQGRSERRQAWSIQWGTLSRRVRVYNFILEWLSFKNIAWGLNFRILNLCGYNQLVFRLFRSLL